MSNLLSSKKLVLFAFLLMLLAIINAAPLRQMGRNDTNIKCNLNCTDEEDQQAVCGSNGQTFTNNCELKTYNCIYNMTLTIKHNGKCRNCTEYANRLKSQKASRESLKRCHQGKPTVEDLIGYPYEPSCMSGASNHIFKPLQSNAGCYHQWCASPDGDPYEETAMTTFETLDCSYNYGFCTVGNRTYSNNDVFAGDCGVCQCSDRAVSCINDYCGNEGPLSLETMNKLKLEIMRLFVIQYQLSDHTASVNLFYIRKKQIVLHEDELLSVLNWKFYHYDMDHNDELNASDLEVLFDDVIRMIKTTAFKEQLRHDLDTDGNGIVTKKEIRNCFASVLESDLASASGGAIMPSSSNTKRNAPSTARST